MIYVSNALIESESVQRETDSFFLSRHSFDHRSEFMIEINAIELKISGDFFRTRKLKKRQTNNCIGNATKCLVVALSH